MYSPTVHKNVLSGVHQIILKLEAFESNAISDWLNRVGLPIKSRFTTIFKKTTTTDKEHW